MNAMKQRENVLPKWSVMLIVLAVATMAAAHNGGPPPKPSAPAPHGSAPAPHASAPSRPAPQQHSAAPSQRPGGTGGSNNRGPGGQSSRPGTPGGNHANANSRGPGGNNANKAGGNNANANSRGPGASKTGGNNANANNRGAGANGANKAGGNNANNRGGANANKPGASAVNRRQPAGSRTVALKSGGKATFRKDGKVRSIQTAKGMKIDHNMRGSRRVESMHNGRKVVSVGKGGGYSQRAYYSHDGRTYVQRTYYVGGQSYAYGYRSYNYGGYPYYGYAPSYYYGPAYYGWAYNPWPAPVYYGWGWGGSPWYGYYGGYYQPYPVYPTAAFWLTDFFLSASLQAAYAAQQSGDGDGALQMPRMGPETSEAIASLWSNDPLIAANLEASYGQYMLGAAAPAAAAKTDSVKLTPEVKDAISEQMKGEIAAEKDAAASGSKNAAGADQVPAALDPKIRMFVVASEEDLTTAEGVECTLTGGDVVYRTGDTPDDDRMVDATVKASKKDECAVGATVGVAVDDLQDMHNQLRIQMDAGLKELASKQGKNGLPAAPDTKTTAGEVPAPSPDTNVANDLQDQKKEADQAETEAQQPN